LSEAENHPFRLSQWIFGKRDRILSLLLRLQAFKKFHHYRYISINKLHRLTCGKNTSTYSRIRLPPLNLIISITNSKSAFKYYVSFSNIRKNEYIYNFRLDLGYLKI